jgi:20S proteasome alpha/beta subunit
MFPKSIELKCGKLSSKLPNITFILGARCIDGVVLVADRKITKINEICSISFEYKRKLHRELRHVIFGVSGSTDTFEFFVDEIKNRINQGDVTLENVTNIISDKVLEINDKRHFNKDLFFCLLVGVQYPQKPTTLTYVIGDGDKRLVNTYTSIGIGSVFAEPFLKNIWNSNLKMSSIAALGWFIIKYIKIINFILPLVLEVIILKFGLFPTDNELIPKEKK